MATTSMCGIVFCNSLAVSEIVIRFQCLLKPIFRQITLAGCQFRYFMVDVRSRQSARLIISTTKNILKVFLEQEGLQLTRGKLIPET